MTTYKTSREILATPEKVFAAFAPQRLKNWWGPKGFTNTFHTCEFKENGKWSFTMHSPDGKNYLNEVIFVSIKPASKVAVKHMSEPKFLLTIELEPTRSGTLVSWTQQFENPEIGRKLADIVIPANEQNLDRLTSEVLNS